MLRLRGEGRMDARKALDFLTRVTILSHPLQRDAAFGTTQVLHRLVAEMGVLPQAQAPAPAPAQGRQEGKGGGGGGGGGGVVAAPDWLAGGRSVPLGAQPPPSTGGGEAATLIDLGLARLLKKLAHDETACYLIYRGNQWIGDVRCVCGWVAGWLGWLVADVVAGAMDGACLSVGCLYMHVLGIEGPTGGPSKKNNPPPFPPSPPWPPAPPKTKKNTAATSAWHSSSSRRRKFGAWCSRRVLPALPSSPSACVVYVWWLVMMMMMMVMMD
jgi:hypothetical protein